MSNKKSRLFGKKDKFNLFIFLCIALFIIFAIYIISVPTSTERLHTSSSNTEVLHNDIEFERELNINENVMDNAIQVKEQDNQKFNKETEDREDGNKNELVASSSDNIKESVDVAQLDDESTAEVSSNTNISFISPVDGSVMREYTSDTIYSKTLNSWRTREGIDFKVDIGTPVIAVLDGTVEKIDNDLTERGQYIVIKHEDGFKTVYTNLDEDIKVVNGQKVKKGEVIALVGKSSGNYSSEEYGSHFNFIMYLNNEEVDPSEYIKFK